MQKNDRKFQRVLILFLVFALGIVLGRLNYLLSDQLPFIYRKSKSEKLLHLIDIINQKYVDKVNTDSIINLIINDVLADLDPHSAYFSAQDYVYVEEDMEGRYLGIGITFSNIIDTPVITKIFAKGPADSAGLTLGDMLLKADTISLIEQPVDSIIRLIRGSDDSVVNLTVFRKYNDSVFQVALKRKYLPLSTVFWYFIDSLSLAYVKITHFDMNTYEEFKDFIDDFLRHGSSGIILDLTDNSGGLLTSSLEVLQEFYPKKILMCYIKGRQIINRECYSKRDGRLRDIPLIVLVNNLTASASEIIAGSLQDRDRAVIIGTRSFGKGLVQSEYQLEDGSVLRLTTARYYTPSGRCLQKPYGEYLRDFWFELDTVILDTTEKFKTISGRTVYGKGGVFPDVIVKDTIRDYYSLASELYLTKTYTNYGPIIRNFKSTEQIINFTDTVFDFKLDFEDKIFINYSLINSVLGLTEALKYYNVYNPLFRKAVELFKSGEYKKILKP